MRLNDNAQNDYVSWRPLIQPQIPYKHNYRRSSILQCDMITERFISAAGRCTIGNKNSCVVYVNGVLGRVNKNVYHFFMFC